MKITLIVHQFLPEFSTGTEVLTYQTAKEFQRRGHNVEVITGFPAEISDAQEKPFTAYEYDGLPVHCYNYNVHVISPNTNFVDFSNNNLSFKIYFREYVNNTKPDIVHIFHPMRTTVSTIEVCNEYNIPVVFTPTDFWTICIKTQLRMPDNTLCLGPDPDGVNCIRHVVSASAADRLPGWAIKIFNALPDKLIASLSRMTGKDWWPDKRLSPNLSYLARRKEFIMERINRLDRVMVPARFMEKMLVQNGLNQDLTSFIPFGINAQPFENIPQKRNNERCVFGFIGTFLEHKGAHILIEAARLIPENIPFEIRLYGNPDVDPTYTQRLKNLIAGDTRIQFCGTFPNDQIGEVFSGIDALVVPSIWYENTPLVMYSAHAAKVPVIGTDLGGISEVVHHEENGLVFEKGDSYGLSLLMKKVIEDRTILSKLATRIEPPQSIPAYVDRVEEVYTEVLEKKNAR